MPQHEHDRRNINLAAQISRVFSRLWYHEPTLKISINAINLFLCLLDNKFEPSNGKNLMTSGNLQSPGVLLLVGERLRNLRERLT